MLRCEPGRRFCQNFFNRIHHECQRGAELVADVGEEVRLGTIDLGERLGALAFRLESTRIRNARGDMACNEIEEGAVVEVEDAARTHTGDQEASGSRLGLCGQREHKGSLDRVRPWTGGGDADSAGKIGYLARPAGLSDSAQRPGSARGAAVDDRMALGEDRRTIIQSRPGDAARAHSVFVEQVDYRKWNIQRIGAQNLGRIPASDLGTPLFWRTGAEIA